MAVLKFIGLTLTAVGIISGLLAYFLFDGGIWALNAALWAAAAFTADLRGTD